MSKLECPVPTVFKRMSEHSQTGNRPHGWMGIHRGHKARPLEWLAGKAIFFVSFSALLGGFLLFVFVAREALPIFLGQMNSALVQEVIPPDDLAKHSPEEIRAYLDLTPQQFAE